MTIDLTPTGQPRVGALSTRRGPHSENAISQCRCQAAPFSNASEIRQKHALAERDLGKARLVFPTLFVIPAGYAALSPRQPGSPSGSRGR